MKNKIYTGIGSRSTPETMLEYMVIIGELFARNGYILRSGGAKGADSAFEEGCDKEYGNKEIYLPWKDFNGNKGGIYPPTSKALEIAKKFHPSWNRCSPAAKLLHARNSHQILGKHCDTPTDLVICWTKEKGGTQQALRIAKHYNIPIINLYSVNWHKLGDILKGYLK